MTYGVAPLATGGVQFRVWAPKVESLAVRIFRPSPALFPMTRDGEDFEVFVPAALPGERYSFVLNGRNERPDPVSRSQPEGVHGPSQIVDPNSFAWSGHEWKGIALADYIFYELHVGTFTDEGTFEAAISKLPHLKDLGITAVELMPVAEFPGRRNWGYDGVDLYAPHSAYGGPEGLKKLVDACHASGLAVTLDVVYNHVGPEGNYLGEFGPYFTDRYRTPWGPAINFDGPFSDGVRRFFIENALYWLTEYHIDALRLDAIHGIFDFSALHILAELRERFHEQAALLGRQAWIIAESDLNDVRVIRPSARGGHALDAQWHDEFHHSIVSKLLRSKRGFLADFGRLQHIGKAITEGFVYDGVYSPYRQRRFGSSSKEDPGRQFVAFIQNHDQIANTCQGFRLSELVSLEEYKLAVMLLLCSPFLPLLFMGEEFADSAPFLYFTSHGDADLARAVTEGRRKEFADFAGDGEWADPQAPEAFEKSKITWPLLGSQPHQDVLNLYRELIALRKRWPSLGNCRKDLTQVDFDEKGQWLRMERSDPSGGRALVLCNFSSSTATLRLPADRSWELALWTASVPIIPRPDEVALAGHNAALYFAS
jgi:maltooligosyltrehalose trehalohydrolase